MAADRLPHRAAALQAPNGSRPTAQRAQPGGWAGGGRGRERLHRL